MTSSKSGQANTQMTRIQNRIEETLSRRPRNNHEDPSNTIRSARERSVLKTACPAPYSGFIALDVRTSPKRFAVSTAGSSLGIPCKRARRVNSMPLDAATGGVTGDSSEVFSTTAAVITAIESRHVPGTPEPFVSSDEAAQFLCVQRRYLLAL